MIFNHWADYVLVTIYSIAFILQLFLLIFEEPEKKPKPLLHIMAMSFMSYMVYLAGAWS